MKSYSGRTRNTVATCPQALFLFVQEWNLVDAKNDRGGEKWYSLKNDIGREFIAEMYANNTFGHMLNDLETILKVMRFSMVLGNIESSRSLDEIFSMVSKQHSTEQLEMLAQFNRQLLPSRCSIPLYM